MKNEWKQIPNYKHYLVSEDGKVKRLAWVHTTIEGKKIHLTETEITTSKNKNNYLMVCLYDGKCHKHFYVHRLVYAAFNQSINIDGKEIDHIDADRTNNHLDNLRLCNSRTNKKNPITLARYKASNALDKGKYEHLKKYWEQHRKIQKDAIFKRIREAEKRLLDKGFKVIAPSRLCKEAHTSFKLAKEYLNDTSTS